MSAVVQRVELHINDWRSAYIISVHAERYVLPVQNLKTDCPGAASAAGKWLVPEPRPNKSYSDRHMTRYIYNKLFTIRSNPIINIQQPLNMRTIVLHSNKIY